MTPLTAHHACGYSMGAWLELPLGTRIRLAASLRLGWGYDLSRPKLMFAYPGIPESLVAPAGLPSVTNCSTLTAELLRDCFPGNEWDVDSYGDLQVFVDRLPARPAAPIEAIERVGVGGAIPEFEPGCWHLVQGWYRWKPTNEDAGRRYAGHAFLVHRPVDGGDLLVLEASSEGPGGPRFINRTAAYLEKRYPWGFHIGSLGPG